MSDTGCNSSLGPLAAVSLRYTHSPDLFLGPVCPYVLSPVSRYAAVWGVPVFTTGGRSAEFRDKTGKFRHAVL